MNKKYIDPKTTKIEISKLRSEGFTDKEIFTQLSEVYYDKDELAKLIKFYTSDESIEKVSFEVKTLKVIFTFILLFHMFVIFYNFIGLNLFIYSNELSFLFLDSSSFLLILVLYSLFKKEITSWTYFILNFYSILSVINGFASLSNEQVSFEIKIINIITNIILAIIFFTFSTKIKSTLFPNLKFRDMFGVKKDMNGEYIFE